MGKMKIYTHAHTSGITDCMTDLLWNYITICRTSQNINLLMG